MRSFKPVLGFLVAAALAAGLVAFTGSVNEPVLPTHDSDLEITLGWGSNWISKLSSSDCKGIASGDRSYCQTDDCKAIASKDRSRCRTRDCKGVASGDRSWCTSRQCKAIASKDRSFCP